MPYLVFAFPIGAAILFSAIGRLLRPHPMLKNSLTGLVVFLIILAFAVPFSAAGVWMIVHGLRVHDTKLPFFAIPFLTVGLAFSAALVLGGPVVFKQGKAKTAHPAEPWLWQSDWASGVVSSHTDSGAVGLWIIALIWNGIAIPAAVGAMQQDGHRPDPKLLIVLLFPAVGLGMLIWALRATVQAIYFGNSQLHLRTIPAALGGALAGSVHIKRALRCTGPISLHLTCNQVMRSGDSSNQSVLWEDQQQLDRLPGATQGSDIPIYFQIPPDERPTVSGNGSQIFWRLTVSAPTAPIQYRSSFKVPVFRVENASSRSLIDEAAQFRRHDARAQPEGIPGVTVSLLPGGGRAIHVAAARNPGAATTVTLLGLVATAIAAGLMHSSAPMIFPIVFGVGALITDIGALSCWLSASTITVRPRSLSVDRGLPLLRRHREIPAESISDINTEISSQIGNKIFYAIVALSDGKRIRLASGIRGKANAEQLILEVKNGLGTKELARAGSDGR